MKVMIIKAFIFFIFANLNKICNYSGNKDKLLIFFVLKIFYLFLRCG